MSGSQAINRYDASTIMMNLDGIPLIPSPNGAWIKYSDHVAAFEPVWFNYDPAYPTFGLIAGPTEEKYTYIKTDKKEFYVDVINLQTFEMCHKKVYSNTKGLHFKHTGYSPTYIADCTKIGRYIPAQWKPE